MYLKGPGYNAKRLLAESTYGLSMSGGLFMGLPRSVTHELWLVYLTGQDPVTGERRDIVCESVFHSEALAAAYGENAAYVSAQRGDLKFSGTRVKTSAVKVHDYVDAEGDMVRLEATNADLTKRIIDMSKRLRTQDETQGRWRRRLKAAAATGRGKPPDRLETRALECPRGYKQHLRLCLRTALYGPVGPLPG